MKPSHGRRLAVAAAFFVVVGSSRRWDRPRDQPRYRRRHSRLLRQEGRRSPGDCLGRLRSEQLQGAGAVAEHASGIVDTVVKIAKTIGIPLLKAAPYIAALI